MLIIQNSEILFEVGNKVGSNFGLRMGRIGLHKTVVGRMNIIFRISSLNIFSFFFLIIPDLV